MNSTSQRIAAVSTVVFALAAAPVIAGNTLAETHAFLEGQRTLTDGQTQPLDLRAASRDSRVEPRAMIAAEREFLFQLARTDGNTEPISPAQRAASTQLRWVETVARILR